MKTPKLPPGPTVPELIITISANGGRCPGCRRALLDEKASSDLDEGKTRITTVQWVLPFEHDPEDCTTELSTVSEKVASPKEIRYGLVVCDELQLEIAKTRERINEDAPTSRHRDALKELGECEENVAQIRSMVEEALASDYMKRAELLNGTQRSLLAHEMHFRLGILGLGAATRRRVKGVNDWLEGLQKERDRQIERAAKMQRALDKHHARQDGMRGDA